jgi:hypothetical protein
MCTGDLTLFFLSRLSLAACRWQALYVTDELLEFQEILACQWMPSCREHELCLWGFDDFEVQLSRLS